MHIDNRDWQSFQENTMNTQDMIAFLEHLDKCDFCLNQMLQQEKNMNSPTPGYLKKQIMTRAASPEITAAKRVSEASYKVQLFYHRVWTLAGVIAALVLLFTVAQINFAPIRPHFSAQMEVEAEMPVTDTHIRNHLYDFTQGIGQGLSEGRQQLNGYLNDFSSKLLNGGK